jgi:hypothetical protein
VRSEEHQVAAERSRSSSGFVVEAMDDARVRPGRTMLVSRRGPSATLDDASVAAGMTFVVDACGLAGG